MKKVAGYFAALIGGGVATMAAAVAAMGHPDALFAIGILAAPLMMIGGWLCSE